MENDTMVSLPLCTVKVEMKYFQTSNFYIWTIGPLSLNNKWNRIEIFWNLPVLVFTESKNSIGAPLKNSGPALT